MIRRAIWLEADSYVKFNRTSIRTPSLALQLKNRREQMLSAKARGELVEKRLVELQASFLLIAMQRRATAMPQAYCDRLAATGDALEVKAILDEALRGLLTEVQDLPNCVDAAEWEKFLAEQEAGGERAGCQIRQAGTGARAESQSEAEGKEALALPIFAARAF